MANEFIIKNGFHSKGDSQITGSLEVKGNGTKDVGLGLNILNQNLNSFKINTVVGVEQYTGVFPFGSNVGGGMMVINSAPNSREQIINVSTQKSTVKAAHGLILNKVENGDGSASNPFVEAFSSYQQQSIDHVVNDSVNGSSALTLRPTNAGFELSNTGKLLFDNGSQLVTFTDNRTTKKGIEYAADYSANFTNRSLIDKEYVIDYVAASASADTIYTADGALAGNRVVDLDGNSFEFTSSAAHNSTPINFEFGEFWQGFTRWDNTGAVQIKSNADTDPLKVYTKVDASDPNFVSKHGGGGHLGCDGIWTLNSTYGGTSTRIELDNTSIKQYFGGGLQHSNQLGGGTPSGVHFFQSGIAGSLGYFIVGGNTRIGTEKISLQEDTLISKKLELSTTTDGFLMPRLTTAQMNAISTPDTHLLIFNTTLNALYRYNGSAWVTMSAGYGIIEVKDSSGNPTFYADLPTAFTAAGSGGVITLHSNITVTSQCTMPGSANATFTINGNGYTITHTANTGSEFYLIYTGVGQNKILYLNDVKIVSNGTATTTSAAIFAPQSGSGSMIIKANSGTFISSINNPCVYLINITGGNWTSTNSFVSFSGEMRDAVITVKSGRGNFINCDITIVSGGQIGLLGDLIDCNITGDATGGQSMIYSKVTQKIHGCTITCTSGGNQAIGYAGGVVWTTANPTPLKDTKIYYYGTYPYAVSATYIASIKDVYIYSDTTTCLYTANTTQTGGYNLENVVLETNATNKAAFYRQDNGNFRMKNVSATNLNSTNTEEAFDIRVSGANELYMEGCSANINNPVVDNVKLNNSSITTGGAYIYGLIMSKIGTGLNLNTVPLLNSNTIDDFGNLKIG